MEINLYMTDYLINNPAGEYTVTVNYGGKDVMYLICYYGEAGSKENEWVVF